jgi:hypothetical protein
MPSRFKGLEPGPLCGAELAPRLIEHANNSLSVYIHAIAIARVAAKSVRRNEKKKTSCTGAHVLARRLHEFEKRRELTTQSSPGRLSRQGTGPRGGTPTAG